MALIFPDLHWWKKVDKAASLDSGTLPPQSPPQVGGKRGGASKDEKYYLASQWQLMGRKLVRHKLAIISLWVLGLFYFMAIFANFIAPSNLTAYSASMRNAPPTKLHLMHEGEFIGPFVYGVKTERNRETYTTNIVEDTSKIYKVKLFQKGVEYKLLGFIPGNIHLFLPEEGGNFFIFGADSLGRDIFSRILLGSQISLTIPLVGTAISFIISLIIGGFAGYFGGWFDLISQRIAEVLGSMPSIPLWMALSAAIPLGIPTVQVYFFITIILSLLGGITGGRGIRSKFFSLKKEDYVMAARISGESSWNIIMRHLVPGFMSQLIVSLTLGIPGMIMGETSMSFLGLGIRSPATSWGVLLQEAQNIASVAQYPWRLIPLIFVIVSVLAFNFLGDGLRDAADPYK
jgi:peptide/nickel transport system permease protein